jgi:pilus assembly protein CpaF
MFVVSVRERGKEEHKFTFRKPEIVVGRLRSNDIILPKRNISKRHAKLELTDDNRILLVDNGSTNGCYLNGKKVLEPTAVGPEDKIFMGDYILQVQILEEKSAIDGAVDMGVAMPDMTGDVESQEKATVADIDSRLLDEELRKMQEEQSDFGPATVVVDPLEVPSEPPPGLEMPGVEAGKAAQPVELEEEERADTLRFREAAAQAEVELVEEGDVVDFDLEAEMEAEANAAGLAEPELVEEEEELIDIDIEEVVAPEEAVAEPTPTAREMPALDAFTPSVGRLETGLSAALDTHYARIAGRFDKWLAGGGKGTEARAKVTELLTEALGESLGGKTAEVAEQVLAELGYLGVVATLLEDPKVGEVFVAASGQVQAFDWRGVPVEGTMALSCPTACDRIARRIIDAAGDEGEEGFAQARLQDGTLASVFGAPFATRHPSLRFVRPYRTTMSLAKLKDTGVITEAQAQELRKAIRTQRNLLVTGRQAATLSLVTHSLVAATDDSERLLVSGDRFAPGTALENATAFAASAFHAPDFSEACAQMGFDRIVLDNAGGETAAAAMEMGAMLQVPFIVSTRLTNPGNIGSLLGIADADTRTAFFELLASSGLILVATSAGKVDSVSLFTVDAGQPKLVPFSA